MRRGVPGILSWLLAVAALMVPSPGWPDSLPPMPATGAPRTLAELWHGYDPCSEPLETEVVREWSESGVRCRYVLFTVGTFKGRRARMAALYAFAEGGGRHPGLLHLHGGGQSASLTTVVFLALNGYAALSIDWGGESVEGAGVGDPNTNWGAVDATQSGHNSHFATLEPDGKTIDPVVSPRNSNWFVLLLAARRALTFLAEQPEVDASRLGVCGHSMGGKLATDLAGCDARVRAVATSCGGAGSAPAGPADSSRRGELSDLALRTIDDVAYLPQIRCPVLYLSPTNDFNAVLDNMAANWKHIGSPDVRYAISPHFNHRHGREFEVCQYLWFGHFLKGGPALPVTPALTVRLDAPGAIPEAALRPDRPGEVASVAIRYSTDPHALTRFWREAPAQRRGEAWFARLPLMTTGLPLYVYASVCYPLKQTLRSFRWLEYDGLTEYAISSSMITVTADELKRSHVKATETRDTMIDDLSGGWRDWYRLEWANPVVWQAVTRKVKDPKWRGPEGARLSVEVLSADDTVLLVRVRQNDGDAFPGAPGGEYAAARAIKGSDSWQSVEFALSDFLPTPGRGASPLRSWDFLTEVELCGSAEVLLDGKAVELGGARWKEPRQFRNLRWLVSTR